MSGVGIFLTCLQHSRVSVYPYVEWADAFCLGPFSRRAERVQRSEDVSNGANGDKTEWGRKYEGCPLGAQKEKRQELGRFTSVVTMYSGSGELWIQVWA